MIGKWTLTLNRLPVQTLREIEMVKVMEEITDIPEWWKKARPGQGTSCNLED